MDYFLILFLCGNRLNMRASAHRVTLSTYQSGLRLSSPIWRLVLILVRWFDSGPKKTDSPLSSPWHSYRCIPIAPQHGTLLLKQVWTGWQPSRHSFYFITCANSCYGG